MLEAWHDISHDNNGIVKPLLTFSWSSDFILNVFPVFLFVSFFANTVLGNWYSFETENKIFAQEAGKITGKTNSKEGTSGVGWYQYEGDDGKVYRVEYEAGPQGFIPKVSVSQWLDNKRRQIIKNGVIANSLFKFSFQLNRAHTSIRQSKINWTDWRRIIRSKML